MADSTPTTHLGAVAPRWVRVLTDTTLTVLVLGSPLWVPILIGAS